VARLLTIARGRERILRVPYCRRPDGDHGVATL